MMQTRDVNKLWKTNDVAAWLKTPPSRIDKLARMGKTLGEKVGRLWQFRVFDHLTWISAGGNLKSEVQL